MTKIILSLFVAALSFLLISCLDIECVNKTDIQIQTYFYNYDTKTKAVPDTLTLYGIDNDKKIFDNQEKVTHPVHIPLKASDNETKFIIEINGTADTIRFVHSNSYSLISKECGYAMFHTIDSIFFTTNEIDSISLPDKEITFINIEKENVAIFY